MCSTFPASRGLRLCWIITLDTTGGSVEELTGEVQAIRMSVAVLLEIDRLVAP